VAMVGEIMPMHEEPVWGGYPKRAWDTQVWVGDPALIRAELGWQASTTLKKGLTRTADWLALHPLAVAGLPTAVPR
jgi:nucleoside-diphosphate-sugar epimerase